MLQAFAARNSGGKVIVQVERVVDRGSIPQRLIHIPGAIVDKVSSLIMKFADVCCVCTVGMHARVGRVLLKMLCPDTG